MVQDRFSLETLSMLLDYFNPTFINLNGIKYLIPV